MLRRCENACERLPTAGCLKRAESGLAWKYECRIEDIVLRFGYKYKYNTFVSSIVIY